MYIINILLLNVASLANGIFRSCNWMLSFVFNYNQTYVKDHEKVCLLRSCSVFPLERLFLGFTDSGQDSFFVEWLRLLASNYFPVTVVSSNPARDPGLFQVHKPNRPAYGTSVILLRYPRSPLTSKTGAPYEFTLTLARSEKST